MRKGSVLCGVDSVPEFGQLLQQVILQKDGGIRLIYQTGCLLGLPDQNIPFGGGDIALQLANLGQQPDGLDGRNLRIAPAEGASPCSLLPEE